MSHDALSPQQFFHVTHEWNAPSIEEHGLLPGRRVRSQTGRNFGRSSGHGIYLTGSEQGVKRWRNELSLVWDRRDIPNKPVTYAVTLPEGARTRRRKTDIGLEEIRAYGHIPPEHLKRVEE